MLFRSHGHLGNPKGKAAGNDSPRQPGIEGKGIPFDFDLRMAFPNEVSPKKGRKELTDNRRPSCTGDAPVEAGHKDGVGAMSADAFRDAVLRGYTHRHLTFRTSGRSPRKHAAVSKAARDDGDAGVAGDGEDRKSTRLNSSHSDRSRMPSSA